MMRHRAGSPSSPPRPPQPIKERAAMRVASNDARHIIPDLIRRAESGETITLTRYHKEVAVIISAERYERLTRNLMEDN
ncbi:type II toxin-antitoxin system prevent-host-death family antitoxin [Streptomyces sp. NPDC001795]|uniref:type II toxin-antitoxin system Phd/YefM family antitoxin n=1 Tax=unclassified Streptomyces TaxID=2593676 RepID=UPI00333169B5